MSGKRIPAHERRKQKKRDEPKKIQREDERQLKAYLEFRTAVESEAVHDEYIREHLQQGFEAMSKANQAKLENETETVEWLQRSLTAPPGGGWLQCLREPLDDNESEPEQPLALSDEQPLALSEQPLALSEQPLALSDEDRLWNTNSVEGCMLDEDRLWTRSARVLAVKMDKTSRVRAYTIDGVQCCLAGLGEKEQRLTFPMSYEVGAALWSKVWVRFATEAEQALDGKWYKELEIKPKTLLHSNGAIANPEDFIGLMGTTVQVLAQERATDPNSGTSIPLMDLTGILTPASQSSRSDES